ncbi:MAG: protein kinase, partial [Rickettsiales bacterium]|nr:protein kinase [Rickettsiales bacterium]
MDNEKEMAAKALNRSNLCPERTFRVEDFQKIGKGSCSNVFAVNYGYPVGNVVVKLLNRGVNNSGEVLYRQFCLTMDGKLSPYLLPTFYTDDNIIIIEHFNGKDLETRLKSGNPQELNLLRSAIEKNYLNLIEGVKSLHDNGIVHRDIKPANMMYNGVKMVFIDFGLAEQIFDGSGLKKKSSRVGTPFYISPELFLMYPTLDLKKSDVWALGLALLESLTGKWLIMNEFIKLNYGTSCGGPAMLSKVFESISSAPREFLNFIRDEIGSIQPPLANQEPWVNLLLGMLNPDPTKRFSVDEALEAAQRIALPQQMLHSSQQYLSPQTQPQQQMQPQPTYPSQPLQNRIGPAQSRQMDLLDPEEQQTPQHYTSQQQQQIYPQGYPYSQVLPSSTSSQQRVPQPQVQNFQYPATQWQTQFPSQPLQNRIGPAQSRQMDLLDPEDKNRKNREEE